MKIILWILLVLLFIVILYYSFAMWGMHTFIKRGKKAIDINDNTIYDNSHYRKYRELLIKNRDYLKTINFEDLYIRSFDNLQLHSYYLPGKNPKKFIVLFHGYRSTGLFDFSGIIKVYQESGYSLVIVDQRAHGKSEGKYIGMGVLEGRDCYDWVEYLVERFGEDISIVLEGMSMGSATIMYSLKYDMPKEVKGLIIDCGYENGFNIMKNTIQKVYRIPLYPISNSIKKLVKIFAKYELDQNTSKPMSENYLPVLIVHGKKDSLVPVEDGLLHYNITKGHKDICLVEGADHGLSYLVDQQKCQEKLDDFLGLVFNEEKFKED